MNTPSSVRPVPERNVSRRRFLELAAIGATLPWIARAGAETAAAPALPLPAGVPPGVGAIIADTLRRAPETLNTDWFGTILLQGLLRWSRRGVGDARAFAEAWFEYHSHRQTVAKFQGPPSRPVRAAGIPISTYVSHYGLAMPCYEMAVQFDHAGARQACIDIANAIVHESHRTYFGLVDHDDSARFAIPDACYFVVTPLMLAAELDPQNRERFREQAVDQVRRYTDIFLNRRTGLTTTMLTKDGLGRTHWTRATGWLLWAMTGVLRFLPQSDPRRPAMLNDLELMARGVARVQDPGGGLHVLLDDPSTPLETTGTAMDAMGFHESVRRGWLDRTDGGLIGPAWEFVKHNITDDGAIVHAYTGWAGPAEERRMVMDHQKQGWVPGFILIVSDEMTTAGA
ncbi:MAG TPA: glycoside hydrolase family 88 protein [Opitutus sp.]|nr:glycoside hydrolase family 88 protein [Opitutus sp.]